MEKVTKNGAVGFWTLFVDQEKCKSVAKFFDLFARNDFIEMKELQNHVSVNAFRETVCPLLERLDNSIARKFPGLKLIEYSFEKNKKGRFTLWLKRNSRIKIRKVNGAHELDVELRESESLKNEDCAQ